MKKLLPLFLLFALLCFNGCAVKSGYMIDNKDNAVIIYLVTDAVSAIKEDFKPAITAFCVIETDETFGTALYEQMRGAGYAVKQVLTPKEINPDVDLLITYTVDRIIEDTKLKIPEIYRMKIQIGDTVYTKAYKVVGKGILEPLSLWSKLGA